VPLEEELWVNNIFDAGPWYTIIARDFFLSDKGYRGDTLLHTD
jgi:hypothetical protein